MKRLLKIIKGAVRGLKENLIPIMVFFIVVFALTPYLREQRGYYAIGGEYILGVFCAIGSRFVLQRSEEKEQSDSSQKARCGFCEKGTTEKKVSIGNNAIKCES